MPAIANGQAVVAADDETADATTTLSNAELLGAMIPEVYEQLRNLAQNYLRGEQSITRCKLLHWCMRHICVCAISVRSTGRTVRSFSASPHR